MRDVDAKSTRLCPECRTRLRSGLERARARRRPFPPRRRDRRLRSGAVFVALLLGMMLLPWGPGVATATTVRFSHSFHLGDIGLECADCHVDGECGRWSGRPGFSACARCHTCEVSDNPKLNRLAELLRDGGAPPWCPGVGDAADATAFHERTIECGSESCRSCHDCDRRDDRETTTCCACHGASDARSSCRVCHR